MTDIEPTSTGFGVIRPDIRVGQVWRRKSDEQLTTITSVDRRAYVPTVAHQAKRHTFTYLSNFLRKYELVEDVS